jgi:putative SOS response-associated peptidase YedK
VRWRLAGAQGEPLAIAGLWERWRAPNGESVASFSMLTINADGHPLMSRFHAPGDEKRSVVLLQAAQIDDWLAADAQQAVAMLRLFDERALRSAAAPRAPRQPKLRP